ncbi:MAG: Xaa-Pro peptidase family protein [Alphaproteobacteria bacterium]|nr:Xaa-Pro peptidase family protein [Alphaproteobacteria bacterium]
MADKPSASKNFGYPFSIGEFKTRLKNVRTKMRAKDIDMMLVTGPENIYYLTGYRTTGYYVYQALVVPANGEPQFVVRRLEFTNVQSLSWIKKGYAVADTESYFEATASCIEGLGGARARIGFDDQGFFLPAGILDALRARLKNATFVPAGGVVEACRLIKSPKEIEYIREAAGTAVMGLEAGYKVIKAGRTENEVAGTIYNAMVSAGSEYVGSQPYVVTGTRSALGHATFERNKIKAKDLVFLEIGGSWYRYGGAIMRTVSVGKPSAEVKKAAEAVQGALEALLAAVKPGVTSGDIDRAGRRIVEKAGLGKYWIHRTGYSIGIGFPPGWGEGHIMDLKPNDPRPLQAGMTFHSVPMIGIPGVGAIGFSETWAVTKTGVEVLTKTSRKMHIA